MGTALVTGASAGLGEEFCWQLASAGHNLVVVARRADRLQSLAHKIEQACRVRVEVLPADLSVAEDVQQVAARLRQSHNPVGLLVNNAGFGRGKPFLSGDFNEERLGLKVMVSAVMELTRAAGEAMVARGRGAILNVSSVASDTGMGTYSAHKAWVKAFSEGLAEELRSTGVTVTAVMPGMVNTEFHDRTAVDVSKVSAISWITPEAVVSQALDAVRRGQVLVTPTLRYKLTTQVVKLAPRWAVRSVTRRIPHM
ncbi:MAG: SDR family oxidoreductase [Actinomycetaceae bacterium]|nr:SDR family oxidoreductase [Actinomycetaceae bacterium]